MSSRKWQVAAAVALIALVTLLSFFSSLDNNFVNWDDDRYVTENPLVKDLSWERIQSIFSSFHLTNYHPLTLLSFSLQYALFGLNPFGYRREIHTPVASVRNKMKGRKKVGKRRLISGG